jgi:hypothetical protein
MHADQREILRAMSPEQRLDVALQLYWSARNLKEAALRQQHPSWPETQVQDEAKRIFLRAST